MKQHQHELKYSFNYIYHFIQRLAILASTGINDFLMILHVLHVYVMGFCQHGGQLGICSPPIGVARNRLAACVSRQFL